ncbi:MAG: ABC transporter ATP-binding protein [Mycoplasmataceae bacterium]|nr:ABC transporter ATP-binding protein [Mycoplasmataceae bacterium]
MKRKLVLQIKDLKVSFKRKNKKELLDIIRGIDISLYEGQIIGIVGESGSGKSVSTRALMNVNSGAITSCESFEVLGKKYDSYKKIDWKHVRGGEVSYIPQNPMTSMNPSRKIGKQMEDVIIEYRKELKTKQSRKAESISILKRFKISDPERLLKLYPHELSGGMKQRVIISMGILAGAKVIIADEPTTALDPTVQASVLQLLQEVNKEFGVAIIFISHNIAVVSKLCDYIYVMYAGKVLEKATRKDLFLNPKHPYTWALIASIPEPTDTKGELYTIKGSAPNMAELSLGDPFAPRNDFALAIDFKQEPPLFEISKTHFAASWTIHPSFPKVKMPKIVIDKLARIKKDSMKGGENVK